MDVAGADVKTDVDAEIDTDAEAGAVANAETDTDGDAITDKLEYPLFFVRESPHLLYLIPIYNMSFLELTEKRFSARKYTDEPVSEADLNYVLECVRLAPSAVNRQPWRFVVVESEAAKQSLWEAYDREWFRSAPLAIVCLQHKGECWTRAADGKPHGDIDVAIAVEHLCLAAAERGLGTCWICNFAPEKMKNFCEDPAWEVVAIVPLGHIAPDCPRSERKRKALEEIVERR